jgi:quercetin dioxygenase-like cupin family protein
MKYVVKLKDLAADSAMNEEKGFTKMALSWIFTNQNVPVTQCAVGHTNKAPGGTHVLHRHTNAEELIIMLKGRAMQIVGDEEFEIEAGDCVFIPKNVVHSQRALEPVETIFIYIGATNLDDTGYELVQKVNG